MRYTGSQDGERSIHWWKVWGRMDALRTSPAQETLVSSRTDETERGWLDLDLHSSALSLYHHRQTWSPQLQLTASSSSQWWAHVFHDGPCSLRRTFADLTLTRRVAECTSLSGWKRCLIQEWVVRMTRCSWFSSRWEGQQGVARLYRSGTLLR